MTVIEGRDDIYFIYFRSYNPVFVSGKALDCATLS